MSTNTGGPAFPAGIKVPNGDGTEMAIYHHGMTLRDWFAGKAMQGMFASGNVPRDLTNDELAEEAYLFADAMIKAREQ